MGGGVYSSQARADSGRTAAYQAQSAAQTFTQKEVHSDMKPQEITVRESCDSDEHPNSIAIIIALDETGSMGHIPHEFIKDGMPSMMSKMMECGVPDPQILFLGIGDHLSDRSPLQVGQFESSDELMDKWLENIHLEGNGGGNGGESYLLAWILAGSFTKIDCWDKRKQKGILVTIGDEPCHDQIENYHLAKLLSGDMPTITAGAALEMAQEKYEVYHIHVCEGYNGKNPNVKGGWEQRLGENVIFAESSKEIPRLIAELVANHAEPAIFEDNPTVGQENPSLGGAPTEML